MAVGGDWRKIEEEVRKLLSGIGAGAGGAAPPEASKFESGTDLLETARQLGVIKTDDEAEYVRSIPEAIRELVRETVYQALTRGTPLDFAWAPGFAWSFDVKTDSARASPQRMVMILSGPHPPPTVSGS